MLDGRVKSGAYFSKSWTDNTVDFNYNEIRSNGIISTFNRLLKR